MIGEKWVVATDRVEKGKGHDEAGGMARSEVNDMNARPDVVETRARARGGGEREGERAGVRASLSSCISRARTTDGDVRKRTARRDGGGRG